MECSPTILIHSGKYLTIEQHILFSYSPMPPQLLLLLPPPPLHHQQHFLFLMSLAFCQLRNLHLQNLHQSWRQESGLLPHAQIHNGQYQQQQQAFHLAMKHYPISLAEKSPKSLFYRFGCSFGVIVVPSSSLSSSNFGSLRFLSLHKFDPKWSFSQAAAAAKTAFCRKVIFCQLRFVVLECQLLFKCFCWLDTLCFAMLDSQNSKVETTTRGGGKAFLFQFDISRAERERERESHLRRRRRRRRKSEKIKGFRHSNDNTFHTALHRGIEVDGVQEKFSQALRQLFQAERRRSLDVTDTPFTTLRLVNSRVEIEKYRLGHFHHHHDLGMGELLSSLIFSLFSEFYDKR